MKKFTANPTPVLYSNLEREGRFLCPAKFKNIDTCLYSSAWPRISEINHAGTALRHTPGEENTQKRKIQRQTHTSKLLFTKQTMLGECTLKS